MLRGRFYPHAASPSVVDTLTPNELVDKLHLHNLKSRTWGSPALVDRPSSSSQTQAKPPQPPSPPLTYRDIYKGELG